MMRRGENKTRDGRDAVQPRVTGTWHQRPPRPCSGCRLWDCPLLVGSPWGYEGPFLT